MTLDSDGDLGWLEGLCVDSQRRVWAPAQYEETVLALNPVVQVQVRASVVRKMPLSWVGFGRRVGIEPDELCKGYPSPRSLIAAASSFGQDAASFEWPEEGIAAPNVKSGLRHALPKRNHRLSIGIYTGGHGGVESDVVNERSPVVHEVCGLEFVFVSWPATDFFALWAAESGHGAMTLDPPPVSFVWPENREWFLHIDPDSCFAALSGNEGTASALMNDSTVETWIASRDGPMGTHTPGQLPELTAFVVSL